MRRELKHLASLVVVGLATASCAQTAAPGSAGQPAAGAGGGGTAAVPDPTNSDCQALSPGPSPLRRLTRFEYNNTVADLLGDSSAPANRFPPEEQSLGFDNDANVLRVPAVLAEGYVTAADDLSQVALANLASFTGCNPADFVGNRPAETACVKALVTRFGERAFRRPVTVDEQTRFQELFETARARFEFRDALDTVLQTMLLAPQFLYRVENGSPVPAAPGVEAVDEWGRASRLSYFLWGSMPDAALFDAARAGTLQTSAQVRAQAERMFQDPRTRTVVGHFHDYWLGLLKIDGQGKDPALFPDYTAQIGPLLRRQTEAFAEYLYFDSPGDLTTLLTAPFTLMNGPLAKYFGVSGPTGDAFVRVELDPTRYAGVVTQPSILSWNATANRTHPILRGKFVREKLLCSSLPSPPNNIIDQRDSVTDPNATERERLEAHRQDPSCAGCHVLMDPLGFALENFDASGRWRDLEGGKPVNVSGELTGTDADGAFVGPVQLASQLARSKAVETCLVTEWSRFAIGRGETAQDACGITKLSQRFQSSGRSLRELVLSMTETDAFLYRTPPSAQVAISGSTP